MPKIKSRNYKTDYFYKVLGIMPSDNFIDKFIEFYNHELHNGPINYGYADANKDTAIVMINSVLAGIIQCIMNGFNVWIINGVKIGLKEVTCYLKNKTTNYLKPTFKFSGETKRTMKENLNKDNPEYTEFLAHKKERYKQIKEYYKNLYDKQGEWWVDEE